MKNNVYAAHSMKEYRKERPEKYIAAIKKRWPKFKVINPCGMFKDASDWKTKCPDIIKQSNILTILEYRGHIGMGQWQEYKWAKSHNKDIFVYRNRKISSY